MGISDDAGQSPYGSLTLANFHGEETHHNLKDILQAFEHEVNELVSHGFECDKSANVQPQVGFVCVRGGDWSFRDQAQGFSGGPQDDGGMSRACTGMSIKNILTNRPFRRET